MRGLSLVAASGGHSSSRCAGLSLSRPLVVEHRLQTHRLSSCGSRAWVVAHVAPRHVGSSQTRARTRVPCIGRQTLNHCATKEALVSTILIIFSNQLHDFHGLHEAKSPSCNSLCVSCAHVKFLISWAQRIRDMSGKKIKEPLNVHSPALNNAGKKFLRRNQSLEEETHSPPGCLEGTDSWKLPSLQGTAGTRWAPQVEVFWAPGSQSKPRRASNMVSQSHWANQVTKMLVTVHAFSEPFTKFCLNDKDGGQLWKEDSGGKSAFTELLWGQSEGFGGDEWEVPTEDGTLGNNVKVKVRKSFYKFRVWFVKFLKENQWVSLTTWYPNFRRIKQVL